ncbi:MAG TPA: acyltransferase [Acidimicrobiales bacterium]|jgi:peptidoglycan/LPS O-acetylase OafA/YrhL|nr:acyltransferase [Acidimicrobiales bacterium]
MSTLRPETDVASLSGDLVVRTRRGGYLDILGFFRVVAFACVVGQHSFLWTGMANNVPGTAFITVLHFTRDAFFFLSALVVCYAQITRPRRLWSFWKRRYLQMGVPYLAWTLIYVVFTILRPGGTWSHFGSYLWSDLWLGYYQLYVVVVLFQLYLVVPLLLRLLRSTRHHVAVMAVSLAFAAFLGIVLHYHSHLGPVTHAMNWMNHWVPWSRDILSYQEFFVAGALMAFHLDRVLAFLERQHRQILWVSGALGGVTVLWYYVAIWSGASTGSASDIYQPIAFVWSFAAIAGILSLSWSWQQRRLFPQTGARRRWPITFLAELSGGVYLSHVLFINMIRAWLEGLGWRDHMPWPAVVIVLYVGTLACALPFVALIKRSPLRWVLGGPFRVAQRTEADAGIALPATT